MCMVQVRLAWRQTLQDGEGEMAVDVLSVAHSKLTLSRGQKALRFFIRAYKTREFFNLLRNPVHSGINKTRTQRTLNRRVRM